MLALLSAFGSISEAAALATRGNASTSFAQSSPVSTRTTCLVILLFDNHDYGSFVHLLQWAQFLLQRICAAGRVHAVLDLMHTQLASNAENSRTGMHALVLILEHLEAPPSVSDTKFDASAPALAESLIGLLQKKRTR